MIARHTYTHRIRYAALLATAVFALLLPGVTHEAHAAGSAALLPDLVADPPDGVELATSTNGTTHVTSMLLRFNGYIHNKGPGAVDFRGTRTAVQLSPAKAEKVKKAEEKKEPLNSPEIEAELAASPMHTYQRLFTTKEGEEETNIERAHIDEPSPAELVYSSADGHNHWHLQHVAKYSLWNSAKSAEAAPAQKVGFCLDDTQPVEPGKGPSSPVYSDEVPPYRDFCEQYHPNATSLFEGISPGWRDIYRSNLALQWVDVSAVLPGEYWLREDVNPLGVVKETGGANVPVYSTEATFIPGFNAVAQNVATGNEESKSIVLSAKEWRGPKEPALAAARFAIASQPQHGTLSAISQGKVNYTPNPGFAGADSFTFSAANPNSQFPTSPAVATVAIEVGEAAKVATVAIEGAPASMTAGTSVPLTAHVANDSPTVTWAASGGSITQGGLYTAPSEPPTSGKVTVTATSAKGAKDQRTITIVAVPPVEAAPESLPVESPTGTPGETSAANEPASTTGSSQPSGGSASGVQQSSPGTGGVLGEKTVTARIAVDRPAVTLFGRTLVMTALPTGPGAIRLSAFLGARRLGSCVTMTPADRSFTCRIPLGKGISARARIRVQATLHDGSVTARSVRAAAPVEPMRMAAHGASAGDTATFWCSPAAARSLSTLR
jgi:hypothetical protein